MNLKKLKQFTPVGNNLICKAHKPRRVHANIVMPDDTMVFTPIATVVACGPDCKQIKEGDVVAIDPGLTMKLLHLPTSEMAKELFCCMAEDKVTAVLDPDSYAAQVEEDGGFIDRPYRNPLRN